MIRGPMLVIVGTVLAVAAAPEGRVHAQDQGQSTVLRADASGFVFRISTPPPVRILRELPEGGSYLHITLPGFLPGTSIEPGLPDLPQKGYPFGLPPGTTARISAVRFVSSEEFEGPPPLPTPVRRLVPGDPFPGQIETFDPDPVAYRSTALLPAEPVRLGPVLGWRHQRVQSLLVSPVQTAPGTGRYRVLREIEVTVRFFANQAEPEPRESVAWRDSPAWDELQTRVLINGGSIRPLRRRSAPAPRVPFVDENDVSIRIRAGRTGLFRISFQTLAGAGWPPGIPVSEVRVEERGYRRGGPDPFTVLNFPRTVADKNGNGVFDAGDAVLFFGFNYQDRFEPAIENARYSYFHTYWIRHTGEPGREFVERDGFPSGLDYAPVSTFTHRERFEKELNYTNSPPDAGSNIFPAVTSLYWLASEHREAYLPFPIHDPAPGGVFEMSAHWQGLDTRGALATHIVSLDLNQKPLLLETAFSNRNSFTYQSGSLPLSANLNPGENLLTVRARSANPVIPASGAWFDWFEVAYDRRLRARDNALYLSTGATTGKTEYFVSGFTLPDLWIVDATEPEEPVRYRGNVSTTETETEVSFRLDLDGTPRQLAVFSPAAAPELPPTPHTLPPDLEAAVAPGLQRDLLRAGQGSDVILITHPEFREAWAPWVAHREAQGHRVFLCDVWEIYDQFAGGDKTPRAIQRFLSHAFREWTPSPGFVLLGGDANEDYRHDTAFSTPDWVPTMMHFGNVSGFSGLELAGSDNWYVGFLGEDDLPNDVLPDMQIGRLPVRDADEAAAMAKKIITYETMNPGDAWRRRGFFLADDQYSTGLQLNGRYCQNVNEAQFRNTTETVCRDFSLRARLPDFECETFFLSDHLDTVAALGRTPEDPSDCPADPATGANAYAVTNRYTRDNLTPSVLEALSRGHLLWEFTGHANRSIIAAEILLEQSHRFSVSAQDADAVANFDKPFIFMGFACHLAEYEYAWEKSLGESMGEALLLAPDRGAIGVISSTAFELIATNPLAQTQITGSLFWNLPRDPTTNRPRRLLGEALVQGLGGLFLQNPGDALLAGMLRTYHLLGDPLLRIDVRPVDIQVSVNGVNHPDGAILTASGFSDTLSLAATLSDDVDVSTFRVLNGDRVLDQSVLDVTPPDSSDRGAQFYQIGFRTSLRLDDYVIRIEAADWTGRTAQLSLPVRFETLFSADGQSLAPGFSNRIDTRSAIEIGVRSSVPLTTSRFSVEADGIGISVEAIRLDEAGRNFSLDIDKVWTPGTHELSLVVSDPIGGVRTETVQFEVSTDPLSLLDAYFYPNPSQGAPGVFVYEVNRSANEGRLAIYSVSGRQLLGKDVEVHPGRNRFTWDLRDQGGDAVANGVYLMLLELGGDAGERVRHLERVVVAR